ncbi:hypothetical protein [Pseudorhodoferax sp.]|uniref:hypothetical protein n=1 Tax=Pseudorhodoferax sp. TaxID=1993553 RepID=UPI002DD66047|nr:hypothetical protein [Pseudorhodoferax sp.]
MPQFLVWDAGSGPSSIHWSHHLKLAWKNRGSGDWTDREGRAQGDKPHAVIDVAAAPAWHSAELTALVKKWLASGENRGLLMRAEGRNFPHVIWAGRQTSTPPRLEVTLEDGRLALCPCLAAASFNRSSISPVDSRQRLRSSDMTSNVVQFDLAPITGPVRSARVFFYATERRGTASVPVFECDPPRFVLGTADGRPAWGLAAEVGEAGLRRSPHVIRAGDFSNLERGVVFDGFSASGESVDQRLPDPDAPGTVMYRGSFSPKDNASLSATVQTMPALRTDPLRPPAVVETEMFCRLYVFLEDDWRSTRDANKMAIGWNLRMGWWSDARGGHWQSTTGNGGRRGTGMKVMAPAGTNGKSQTSDRWEYQGHSIRMEAGVGVDDGNPYESLRPLQSYVYHLDQTSPYGQVFRLGTAVMQRGRWHCLEQQIRINSIEGPYDALGNGTAVPDGLLVTWLDGVEVSRIGKLRWRRHPEMGIQGPWINWYYGGQKATERTMHYRMNHFVVARRYIGPRRA